jgi:hypothetical protein
MDLVAPIILAIGFTYLVAVLLLTPHNQDSGQQDNPADDLISQFLRYSDLTQHTKVREIVSIMCDEARYSMGLRPGTDIDFSLSGDTALSIPAFCELCIHLSQIEGYPIRHTLQTVVEPHELVQSSPFLEYAVSILCAGGYLGYVIAEKRYHAEFLRWREGALASALVKKHEQLHPQDKKRSAYTAIFVQDALQRIISLPVTDFNFSSLTSQVFVVLNTDSRPAVGAMAHRNHELGTTSLSVMSKDEAMANYSSLVASIIQAIGSGSQNVRGLADEQKKWIVNAGIASFDDLTATVRKSK